MLLPLAPAFSSRALPCFSCRTLSLMPKHSPKVYGKGHLHFITCRFFEGNQRFAVAKHRDLFAQLLEELRAKFHFQVVGYALMPDHFDLLMTEPANVTVDNLIDTLRKRYGRRYNNSARSTDQVWETRYQDLHVHDPARIQERLRFMHEEPVKAGLVKEPSEWDWSSARFYAGKDTGRDVGVLTIDPAIDPRGIITQPEQVSSKQ